MSLSFAVGICLDRTFDIQDQIFIERGLQLTIISSGILSVVS
jgi:hypothetical protein